MGRRTKVEAAQTRQEIIDAARRVFHERGVSRTSMENVAQAAGVSRGAIYWHFENKAALFYAMREQTARVLDQVHSHMLSPEIANPLDAIEHSLCLLFEILENNPLVRETFEIMSLRCEYVDEFAPVLQEVMRPHADYPERPLCPGCRQGIFAPRPGCRRRRARYPGLFFRAVQTMAGQPAGR